MPITKEEMEHQRKIVSALADLVFAECPDGIYKSKHYAELLEENEKLDRMLIALEDEGL